MPADPDPVDALTRVLVRACRELAEAGSPRHAGQLAASGWVALRTSHPRQAQHLDGAMHYIARLEQERDEEQERDGRPPPVTPAVQPAPVTSPSSTPQYGRNAMSTDDRVLDVREEIPRRRHELIFETFGTLAPDTAFILVNDHDPKPLKYQFEAENAGEFTWEYLEEGPEVWRVRIGRTKSRG